MAVKRTKSWLDARRKEQESDRRMDRRQIGNSQLKLTRLSPKPAHGFKSLIAVVAGPGTGVPYGEASGRT